MTRARQVLPHETVMVTRRCSERRYFLKPSRLVNQIVRYLLAVGSVKYGIELVSACFMANHYHLVAVDERGDHPGFTTWLNGMMARAMNSHRRRRGSFWSGEQVNVCVLPTSEDALERSAYVLNNPVASGMVARGADWPGFRSSPHAAASRPQVVKRPKIRFFKNSKLPEQAELRFVVPPGHEHKTAAEFGDELKRAVEAREVEVRERKRRAGRRFAGVDKVRRLVVNDAPKTDPGSGFFPRVASSCAQARHAVLARIATFEAGYREARLAFRDGDRGVLFPFGTYRLRHVVGVLCHPPP